MTNDDVNIQLSAYADGELSPVERAAIEARLLQEPALATMLAQFKKFSDSAKTEQTPDMFSNAAKDAWPLLSEKKLSIPQAEFAALSALAKSEICPAMSGERAQAAWKNISGRALQSFNEAALFNAPKVSDENWSQAWKHITTRMRTVAVVPPAEIAPKKKSVPAPAIVPINPKQKSQRPVSIWGWVGATGLAAAAMFALVLYAPEVPTGPDAESSTSMAMSIPESQDERYGVLVKYVPGSDDPVICLYEKTPGTK